jgi:hypothetical protein
LELAREEKEQEERNRLDAGKQARPAGTAPGQSAQDAAGTGSQGSQGWAAPQGNLAAPAQDSDGTIEEAEATLVRRCVAEAVNLHHKGTACEKLRLELRDKAARTDLSKEEKRQAVKAWEAINAEYWSIQEEVKTLDTQHTNQARRLRVAFGTNPDQAVDIREARTMEIAREQEKASQELARYLWEQTAAQEEEAADKELGRLQQETAQEYEAQRATLGEQAEELRRQLTLSDREEEEARAAHRQKTLQLAQLMAEQQEVEATARTFLEDMAQVMAAGKAKDKAARLHHLRSSVE